ncbi:1-phosphatidylinositol-3-phosphate 5-kinase [Myotisia sp. PD_48]|nr:1-phosphatidylinositol-3-phosphate 5-kinase [Myotisia sp. PD_48]
MASHTQEPSSPSASSIFLPLGRRSRRGSHASLGTQGEKESLTEALDQIHNAASQLDTLTVFNEFTNPPVPSAAADNKGLVGDLQGGLSGLYNMFRASVGGVRDIVGGPGKGSEANSQEGGRHGANDMAGNNFGSMEALPSRSSSTHGSKAHSPVLGSFPSVQEGTSNAWASKSSKFSSKAPSVSSKASIPGSNPMKSPLAPLTRMHSAATGDPTITEPNIAVKDDNLPRNRSNSGSVATTLLTNTDLPDPDRKDHGLHISSSQVSQDLAVGVLPGMTEFTIQKDSQEPQSDRAMGFDAPSRRATGGSQKHSSNLRSGLPEIDTNFTNSRWKANRGEGTHDMHIHQRESHAKDSNVSLPDSGVTSISNSIIKSSPAESMAYDAQTATTMATSFSTADRDLPSAHSSRASISRSREKLPPPTHTQVPKVSLQRMASSETTRTRSTAPRSYDTSASLLDPERTNQATKQLLSPRQRHNNTAGLAHKLLDRAFWMRDENAKGCFHCDEPFSTFRRKHHCRVCGQIFDAKCTTLVPGASFGSSGSIRVCKPCNASLDGSEDDSSDFSGEEIHSPAVIDTRSSDALGSQLTEDDASSIRSQSMDHVLKTPTMAIPATRRTVDGSNRRSAVLEIDSGRPLTRPTSSRSLRSSLNRNHSVSHKRHYSRHQYIRNVKPYLEDRAPFQRRIGDDMAPENRLPAFHRDSIIDPDLAQYLSDDASTEDEQPNLFSVVSEGNLSRHSADNEKATFGGLLAAVKKGRSRFGDKTGLYSTREVDDGSVSSSRAVNLPRSTRRRNLSVASSIHQRPSTRNLKENPSSMHFEYNSHHSIPPPAPSGGFKMTRSSSMRGAGAPAIELNKASLEHVRKLLQQLLRDTSVPHPQSWETALMPILLKATDDVEPNVQHGDDMDIRHYVKLKKIPGSRPSDTSYVSGLVFTKNLALKSMPRNISHPRILILTFPLEYARQQQHFMSLDPLIRQEREFLENLVNRIAALKPNVLLVTKHVSGLALQLLEKANIATAYNVKESVIEAVSRCTETRIVTSLDRLATPTSPGSCLSFDLKTYMHGGRKKTYMYITGCPKELGCTIVLRGADNDVLIKIKRITEFMVYVVYNLKLETCLMRDEFAKIPSSPAGTTTAIQNGDPKTDTFDPSAVDGEAPDESSNNRNQPGVDQGIDSSQLRSDRIPPANDALIPAFYEDMVEKHQTKILSASPFVKFRQPYLLMRARELERRLAYLKGLRDQHIFEQQPEEGKTTENFLLITPETVHKSISGASSKVKEVLHAVHDAEYDRALHHYQTQKRQWESYISGNINLFDPYAHQNIVVLFSLVCTKTSIPCSGPDTFALGFYSQYESDKIFEGDCTLGQYVEDLCHTANSICAVNGCEERMFDHHRQYVHGDAQVSVFVQPYPAKLRGLQDTILMWSCCKICGNETPAIPMSDGTWKYSFGKYLELSFSSADLQARAGVCPHDLHRDHLRYFGFKDMALRIHYDPITLLEIIVPRPRVTWKVDKDLNLRNDIYTKGEKQLNKFMISVKARLKYINVETVMPEMAQACREEIDTLIKRANDDHATLLTQHQEQYMNTRYWEVIPLNRVILAMQEKVVEWDATFAEFEKNYFPSEKDIRRLAALQLKTIFLGRDDSSTSLTTSEESAITPTETDDGTPGVPQSPKLSRKMTMTSIEAKKMLASVVEEHTGKTKKDIESADQNVSLQGTESESTPELHGLKPVPDPSGEVRHLDLAISGSLAESMSPPKDRPLPQESCELQSSTGTNLAPVEPAERDGSDTLEQSNRGVDDTAKSQDFTSLMTRPSALPRLREKTFPQGLRVKSPPLLRAHSQPGPTHPPAPSNTSLVSQAKQEQNASVQPDESNHFFVSKTKGAEKQRLSERLRLMTLKSPKLPSGQSLIPRSIAKKKNSNVFNLARHFEEINREFENERLMQRRHLRAAHGKQSRAYPMASSKPIVEVYKNVREAVEERDPSDEDFLHGIQAAPTPKESTTAPDSKLHDQPPNPPKEPPIESEPVTRPSEESTREDSHSFSEPEAEDEPSDHDNDKNSEKRRSTDTNEEAAQLAPDEIELDLKELPKHERSSLVRLLANFWAERSASGWLPLDYPLNDSDHVFEDCDIIVREDEPSSLIAFALNSEDYKQKLKSIQKHNGADVDANHNAEPEVEQSLLRSTGTHLKYQFQEGQAKMLCKVFYAEQFDALRRKCGVAERIVESMSRCMKWDSKGGKTKSLFLKTLDDRFILKSLSTIETQAFLKFAPDYFQIMSEALFHELPSAIAKMFGFYQVIIKNPITGVEFNWFLLVMENLFYDRTPTRIFDLKGSMRNRKVQMTGERNEVLLDENMVEFIYESPLFTREHSKKLLSQSVWNDTLFLARQNVMDYSLMIAIDEKSNELVVGIIDCIRTYTWDKKLESWIKDRGFAGGGKNRPTVTSPKEYKSRFREAMARYVLYAPDSWHQFQIADPDRRIIKCKPEAPEAAKQSSIDVSGQVEG